MSYIEIVEIHKMSKRASLHLRGFNKGPMVVAFIKLLCGICPMRSLLTLVSS